MYEPTEAEIEEAKKVIPSGLYCYAVDEVRMAARNPGEPFYVIPCPFWSRDKNKPPQENGCCSFLKTNDEELNGGLLWDQVKECGINHDYEDWEE